MRHVGRVLLVFLLVALICQSVWEAHGAGRILIHVKVVSASNVGNRVDPALNHLAKQLGTLFNYSSYQLLTKRDLRLDINQQGMVSLPEGERLKITPKEFLGDRIRLIMNLEKKGISKFNTTIRLANGRTILIGGPRYRGKVLIFSISVSF